MFDNYRCTRELLFVKTIDAPIIHIDNARFFSLVVGMFQQRERDRTVGIYTNVGNPYGCVDYSYNYEANFYVIGDDIRKMMETNQIWFRSDEYGTTLKCHVLHFEVEISGDSWENTPMAELSTKQLFLLSNYYTIEDGQRLTIF